MTKQDLLKDENFLSALVMPEIQVYTIWDGGPKISYYAFRGDTILFQGNDFKPSPLHNIDDLESIVSLLGFLTVKPGDTDKEYFKDYTPQQFEWCKSQECETISLLISDYEDSEPQYKDAAIEKLESYFTTDPSNVTILV